MSKSLELDSVQKIGCYFLWMVIACCALPACADSRTERIDYAPFKIAVTERSAREGKSHELLVRLDSGRGTYEERYLNRRFDPEKTNVPPLEVIKSGNNEILLVHSYSGGARCCWTLLAFNLSTGKPLGDVVESQAPIQVKSNSDGCEVAAKIVRIDSKEETTETQRRHKFQCIDDRLK